MLRPSELRRNNNFHYLIQTLRRERKVRLHLKDLLFTLMHQNSISVIKKTPQIGQ